MAKCSNCEGFGYTLTPSGDDADTQLVTNCKECGVVNDCPGDNG